MSPAVPGRPRIVLDTNVCLDVFVFDDPAIAPLRAALASGAIDAVTRDDCRDEWLRVLGYPQLRLDDAARDAAMAAFDRHVTRIETMPLPSGRPLPRCADQDDQKFLELTRDTGARWLLSRDDALLTLARRVQRDEGFQILTPQAWAAEWAAHADCGVDQISKR